MQKTYIIVENLQKPDQQRSQQRLHLHFTQLELVAAVLARFAKVVLFLSSESGLLYGPHGHCSTAGVEWSIRGTRVRP